MQLGTTYRLYFIFALLLASLGAVSCAEKGAYSPKLWASEKGGQSQFSEKIRVRPKVDILFIVDDSGSMDDERELLADQLGFFVDSFFDSALLDYRAIVTMMSEAGNLPLQVPYIDPQTVKFPKDEIKRRLTRNTQSGLVTESTFDAVYLTLHKNGSLFREDAVLNIIFLSDEDEQSLQFNGTQFYRYLLNFKGGKKEKIVIFGIINTPESERLCPNSVLATEYVRILPFMEQFGDGYLNICSSDYGQGLTELAQYLSTRLSVGIELAHKPLLETVRVFYGPYEVIRDFERGWWYDPVLQKIFLGHNFQTSPPLSLDDPNEYELRVEYNYF